VNLPSPEVCALGSSFSLIIGLAALPSTVVLLGMSTAFFALAAWRFRYD
jgi:hypothetical protein